MFSIKVDMRCVQDTCGSVIKTNQEIRSELEAAYCSRHNVEAYAEPEQT
jgi:hypothetical protein